MPQFISIPSVLLATALLCTLTLSDNGSEIEFAHRVSPPADLHLNRLVDSSSPETSWGLRLQAMSRGADESTGDAEQSDQNQFGDSAMISNVDLQSSLESQSSESTSERVFEVSRRVREMPGLVQAERMIDLYATAPGIVQRVYVHEGDWVEAGEVLVSFEDQVTRAALGLARIQAESRGSLEYAKSEVLFAESMVQRMESVLEINGRGISQQEIESARVTLSKAKANLSIAEENFAQAQTKYELELARTKHLQVIAPFAGIVTKLDVESGEKAFDNLPLLKLVDPTSLSVVLYIPWEHRGELRVGLRSQLVAEGPVNQCVDAELLHVDPVLDVALQAVRTRWRISNTEARLPVGFLVRFDDRLIDIVPSTDTHSN